MQLEAATVVAPRKQVVVDVTVEGDEASRIATSLGESNRQPVLDDPL
jgi:hypothetical protein